jgi:predicted secreted hydrolase
MNKPNRIGRYVLSRRRMLRAGLGLGLGASPWSFLPGTANAASAAAVPSEIKKIKISFPRDAGAHPEFATEWWYVTGYASEGDQEAAYGFQVTFFRSRVAGTQSLQSRLAAKQLLCAHAAITDVNGTRLWHDPRIARWSGLAPSASGTDQAFASELDTSVAIRDWSLQRMGQDLRARVKATNFELDLTFVQTQNVLLQGESGLSRKGPQASQSSWYYSLPQLRSNGVLTLNNKSIAVGNGGANRGTAWLDHEWSNTLLGEDAAGWDWIGINLFDNSALTAFQLRDKSGTAFWAGGSFRSGDNQFGFHPGEVTFKPLRTWRSPLTKASYPVEWLVRTPADFYTVRAIIDNQELDSTHSTGAIYWEGLCEVWDSNNRKVGRGYLEMTGYAAPLKL